MATFETIYDSENVSVVLITASYTAAYAEKDFNAYPAFSFPVYSAFEYKSGNFRQVLDSNSLLLEPVPLDFEVFKFNDFNKDITLCISFKEVMPPDSLLLHYSGKIISFRRRPEEEILLQRLLQHAKGSDYFQLEQSVFELLDAIFAQPDRPISLALSKLPFTIQRIDDAKVFIHGHFAEDISIIDIASKANLSPFHFSRIFKKYTGHAPYDYLLLVRIEQARLLLTSGSDITETAFSTGFNSLENFSYTFKKMTGFSPSQFQKSKISKIFL